MANQENIHVEFETLQANLYLLATDFETLKNYLEGYSNFGIYQECIYGVREPMEDFPAMIRSGKLSLETIAKLFECYYLMETLSRHPSDTNNEEAFKNHEQWNKVRSLAKEAADMLPQ